MLSGRTSAHGCTKLRHVAQCFGWTHAAVQYRRPACSELHVAVPLALGTHLVRVRVRARACACACTRGRVRVREGVCARACARGRVGVRVLSARSSAGERRRCTTAALTACHIGTGTDWGMAKCSLRRTVMNAWSSDAGFEKTIVRPCGSIPEPSGIGQEGSAFRAVQSHTNARLTRDD